MSKQGSFVSGIMDAFCTCVSIGLQHGIPLSTFIHKFKYTGFEPAGMVREAPSGMHKGIFIARSILDYLFHFLEYRFPDGVLRSDLGDATKQGAVTGQDELEATDRQAGSAAEAGVEV